MASQRARERTRRGYAPDELRVLFIGESPPTGGKFFYDANSVLYFATREAFIAAIPTLAKRPHFLEAFQRLGCYLDDLSLRPIDKLPKREKLRARDAATPALARRLKGLTPRLVVVVVKGIRPQVHQVLGRVGLEDVPCEALPFPGQWHRADYVAELTALVKRWRRQRLLRAI